MTNEPKGGDLFIVDNSVSGWTGLRYLEEWCTIAKSFDIATGNFEIGSLLALDGKWQPLERIRILMGAETTYRTKKALLEAIKSKALEVLDQSIEQDKDLNPFLAGVPGIVAGMQSGQIQCRVYDIGKFHAKAYITHAKLAVVGAQALVGSSNFTKPGLTENIELNIQVQSGREVAQLQGWFDHHWEEGKDVTDEVMNVISRHTYLYTPFDVYTKALQEFFRGHEMTASECEDTRSRMFSKLDRYQKEAYWALMKIARQHGGAFLCDGVGLGKTFVGLMLIERLILHEGKRVVLFAPKAAKEAVWEPHLRDWLPHIGGVSGGADFSNLAVFSHTDLNRKGDFPERFRRITELADVVLIDEAHHFRNPGREGEDLDVDDDRSRYYRLYDLLDSSVRPKTLFMLTATPINNRLSDFRHMTELFSRKDEAYFARTLGVNNLRAYFNNMEKALRKRLGEKADVGENIVEVQETLAGGEIFRHLVVQRSRAYARESQIRENRTAAAFPERKPPIVAEYSIRQTYGRLLDLLAKAFQAKNPLFNLPIYYPLAYYKGDDKSIDPFEENRQKQVVGLIRTMFLKRFESSVAAFELSCDRLMRKLLAFLGTSFQEALPDEPEPEPIVDEVVENPPAGAALDLHLATAMNLRAVANSVADANRLLGGGYGCSDGAVRRSNAVLCKAEVLRWILDESLSKTALEPDGLPSIAASIAVTALTARSEAGAIGVIVEPFNAGVRFVPYERNLGVVGLPAGAVWTGDFEAWRRVAAFTLSKLRSGVDSGILLCALSDGSATVQTGGSLLRRK